MISSSAEQQKIWQVSAGGLHPLVEAYTVGEDYLLDEKFLLPFDIKASKAHAKMLQSIGVLTAQECEVLQKALDEILQLWEKGEFKVPMSMEDGHTAIEAFITAKYGDVGKKIHTGRSRNDQSLVMIRLFMIESVDKQIAFVESVRDSFKEKAKAFVERNLPMPGYTHMQKAMPASVSLWLDSFASAFEDCLPSLRGVRESINQNPLGSAAGFGINHLELDREMTAKELGFARVQSNPLYCGLSRGMFEGRVLDALCGPMVICTRFAVDVMMFTQQEFSFFRLPDEFVTGSSIMPQKKNYDLFEIMRANGRIFFSLQQQVTQVVAGLGSGYHRDLQTTKKAFVEAVKLSESTLVLLKEAVPFLHAVEQNLKASMTEELFVTDEVYRRVAAGEAFRSAYQIVKAEFQEKLKKKQDAQERETNERGEDGEEGDIERGGKRRREA
uniref:Fumarate lyase N-terminal domain-containing protein n=1 Tax=Chromera velia CCMP2878 TaxID=1169474 RepID=A0A0G4H872_9ALVE|mmetsp:Transcript_13302/g.26261  ORF Transcript_13302/g.26261 Transcript_13302/m.26261 type:complete len:442 (-) Transcript_13302:266-1591(-)|eukprot:Cvel_25076.t1-p1 / transcript=Cvel_25076.t1 / gene=Cvel_25076 / organism=Chromera_velia_CCMP2878 / gene_product=Argininosuccinate lyase, putative / transcript_product=Argininosuccinate lyase, putative / location=Cvel_scaffold2791:13600-19510(-) / protein_length=441 / sequence_SO=supercontig / SO=protein_coding / is_pseudo=false